LEIKKKELIDTLMLQNAQLVDLGQTIAYHQNTIDSKKEQVLKMDNQLVIQHGKSKSDKHQKCDKLSTLIH
jgi:hypothetical protein